MTEISTQKTEPIWMRRDNAVLIIALAAITLISWGYLIHDANGLTGIPKCCIEADGRRWGWPEFGALFSMWTIMMVGMMVPTVAPMVLMFATISQKRRETSRGYVSPGLFLLGYLLVWTGFSALAAGAQWGLHRASLMSPAMVTTNRWIGGGVLVLAGIFQWTPAKNRCLGHCRSPMDFLLTEWKEGSGGAVRMGLRHGLFCTGCCWLLMALLFVVGVMNLLWVAAVTVFVLLEKTFAGGKLIARLSGACLIGWGLWMCARIN